MGIDVLGWCSKSEGGVQRVVSKRHESIVAARSTSPATTTISDVGRSAKDARKHPCCHLLFLGLFVGFRVQQRAAAAKNSGMGTNTCTIGILMRFMGSRNSAYPVPIVTRSFNKCSDVFQFVPCLSVSVRICFITHLLHFVTRICFCLVQ
jgi:hypothetical protein